MRAATILQRRDDFAAKGAARCRAQVPRYIFGGAAGFMADGDETSVGDDDVAPSRTGMRLPVRNSFSSSLRELSLAVLVVCEAQAASASARAAIVSSFIKVSSDGANAMRAAPEKSGDCNGGRTTGQLKATLIPGMPSVP